MSTRERQIAEAVLADQEELAIAERLRISPHTVHTHLEQLYHKLGVGSRVQLVVRLAEEAMRCVDKRCRASNFFCHRRTAGRCPLDR